MSTIWFMAKRTGNPKIAIASIRVSTDDQKLGPEAQRSAIEAWAAREGVQVAAWHVDAGVSGASPIEERPGLLAALSALREHDAGVLVVAKRDRVARDIVIGATVERAANTAGAKLVSADGAGNAEGIEGMMVRGMTDLFAAVEREMIRSRTKAALAAKKAKGERVSRHMPYGYRLSADGVRLERDEDEQAVIAIVRTLRAEGLSQRAIAAALSQRGLLSRVGKPYAQSQVACMLRAG
jgi:DNA invertase Pin-like site-specific DNA recombinase